MRKKILQIVDVKGWAIDRLAKAVVEHNPQFSWRRIFVHPRDIPSMSADQLQQISDAVEWCDVIEAQYWRTFTQLRDKLPAIKTKKVILTHHNEENLLTDEWDGVDLIVAKTKYSLEKLKEAGFHNVVYIPNSFDPRVFSWNPTYPPAEFSVGYAGRIVGWKGLKEILQACYELKVPLKILGKLEDQKYFESIPEEHREMIDYTFFQAPDDEIQNFYRSISVFVCNSGPGREVGPLPVIEAMASGVPVITTKCGLVADMGVDRENMLIVPFGNAAAIKKAIAELRDNVELAKELKDHGWRTIKNYTDITMARSYGDIIYRMLRESRRLVSIVIAATYDRTQNLKEIIAALEKQTYSAIEIIIAWDEEDPLAHDEREVDSATIPVRHLYTRRPGYNLAHARNLGVIEAFGEIVVICDSRWAPHETGIEQFVEYLLENNEGEKVWLFGDKFVKGVSVNKQSFVENWSCIRRKHLIEAGLFNEVVTEYGGMSQELRSRFLSQGFKLLFCPEARADELGKSSSRGAERKSEMIRMKELMNKLGFER